MYVLGTNDSHNGTAALVKDGVVVACVSEERFSRVKNEDGFSSRAVDWALRHAGISARELDLVVLGGHVSVFATAGLASAHSITKPFMRVWANAECLVLALRHVAGPFSRASRKLARERSRSLRARGVSNRLGVEASKVITTNHHLCHALTAYYALADKKSSCLLLTLDGDDACATVYRAVDGVASLIAKTRNHNSIAGMYLEVTQYLRMKPLEHEYKVMGLAPYAKDDDVQRTCQKIRNLVRLTEDGLTFHAQPSNLGHHAYMKKHLEGHRFDCVAGAVQKLFEELVVNWVRNAIKATGTCRVAVAGGAFMNVKANMLLLELPELKEFFVFLSCGDESLACGAAFYGFHRLIGHGISAEAELSGTVYWGPEYSNKHIEELLARDRVGLNIVYIEDMPGKLAQLLAAREIVDRFAGRMGWGARALGNRSILAHPADPDTVRTNNEAVKMRDFWMPFAPTILNSEEAEYIHNPKRSPAPYMTLAFHSKPKAHKDLKAAIHPYDFTVRPQVLRREDNPQYHELIYRFKELTGIGAILNTSFNLHGFPIVCSPEDALDIFRKSGLKYMALENYMVSKCQD